MRSKPAYDEMAPLLKLLKLIESAPADDLRPEAELHDEIASIEVPSARDRETNHHAEQIARAILKSLATSEISASGRTKMTADGRAGPRSLLLDF